MIRVRIERIGGICEAVERIGGDVGFAAERLGGVHTTIKRLGGIEARAYRKGGIICRMYQEVRPSLSGPYLEIAPSVVWVLAGWTSNDVFSNISWNIE